MTNADGRTAEPLLRQLVLGDGIFELVFPCGPYFHSLGVPLTDPPFLDRVVIRFGVAGQGRELSRAAAALALRLQHLPGLVMTGAEIIARCQVLAGMSETPGAITRTLSVPCHARCPSHAAVRGWKRQAWT